MVDVVKRKRPALPMPAFVLLLIGGAASGVVVWVALSSGQYSDFVVWYEAARALREGRDLYFSEVSYYGFRNMNPPHLVVLIAPLAWLSLRDALIAWWGLTVVAMFACVRLWSRALPPGWSVTVFSLLLASVAGYGNVRFGNQSWLTAWAVTWAWIAWRRGSRNAAASMLGFVASVKLFVLIFGPYLAWKRRWRELIAFATGGVLASALGVLVCGPEAYRSWYGALQEQTWQGTPMNISVLGTFTRALAPSTNFVPLVDKPALIMPMWLVTSAALAAVLWWRMRQRADVDRDFAALLTAMLLVSPSGWAYYLPLAAGPLAAAAVARPAFSWKLGVACLLIPFWLLSSGPASAWVTITLGTAYMWGGLLLLASTLREPVPAPIISEPALP